MARPYSRQELFDKIVRHAAKQGKKAVDSNGKCMYRSPDGCMCLSGCPIPDDIYDPEMERNTINYILQIYDLSGARIARKPHRYLLMEAQRIHDFRPVRDWKEELRSVANKFSFRTNVLEKVKWNNFEDAEAA